MKISDFIHIITSELGKRMEPITYMEEIPGNMDFSLLLGISQDMVNQKHKSGENPCNLPANPNSMQPKGDFQIGSMKNVFLLFHASDSSPILEVNTKIESDGQADKVLKQDKISKQDVDVNILMPANRSDIAYMESASQLSIPLLPNFFGKDAQPAEEHNWSYRFLYNGETDIVENRIDLDGIPDRTKSSYDPSSVTLQIDNKIRDFSKYGGKNIPYQVSKETPVGKFALDLSENKKTSLIEAPEINKGQVISFSRNYGASSVTLQSDKNIVQIPFVPFAKGGIVVPPTNGEIGALERWGIGAFGEMGHWSIGALEHLGKWGIGALEHWSVGALDINSPALQRPSAPMPQCPMVLMISKPAKYIHEYINSNKTAKSSFYEFNTTNSKSHPGTIEMNYNGLELGYKNIIHIDKASESNEIIIIPNNEEVHIPIPKGDTHEILIIENKASQSGYGTKMQIDRPIDANTKITTGIERTMIPNTDKNSVATQQLFMVSQSATDESEVKRMALPEEKAIVVEKPQNYIDIRQNHQAYIENPETLDIPASKEIQETISSSELQNKICAYINDMKLSGESDYISANLEIKDLGNIKLKVFLKDSKVFATLIFDRPETMKAMELQMPDIRRNLEKDQIQVSEFKLSLGNEFMETDQRNSDFYNHKGGGYATYNYKQQRENTNNKKFSKAQDQLILKNIFAADTLVDLFI